MYDGLFLKLLVLLITVFIVGCQGKKETYIADNKVQNGIYLGYFEYQNQKYWCEIEFINDKYVEWPSGGAMFQKSYGCLTVGTWSAGNGKLTFNMGSYKMPGYPESCVQDMLMPGQYNFYDVMKSDSLVFENGSNAGRIKYHLVKLQLD